MTTQDAPPAAPRISVIIAAYNVAETLSEALASLTAQTMPDLEIIVVDDVSRDATLDVARKAAQQDPRIKVVARAQNGGPGAARNSGLDVATGEWIAVVDGDDVVRPDRFAAMLTAATDTNADIVFDNLIHTRIRPNGTRSSSLYIPDHLPIFGSLSLATFLDSQRRKNALPSLGYLKPLIRRATLDRLNVRYHPSLMVGEDSLLIATLMSLGAHTHLMREAYYEYIRREGTITSFFKTENMQKFFDAYSAFEAEAAPRLSTTDTAALRALIDDSAARLRARHIMENLLRGRDLLAIRHAITQPKIRRYFIIDCRSYIKKLIRFVQGKRA